MDDVEIRLARDDDLEQVAGLRWTWMVNERGTASETSRDEFVARFAEWALRDADSYECWVAAQGPLVVGMAWWLRVPRVPSPRAFTRTTADVQSVFVLPSHRGSGVGGRLIAAVVQAGAESGAERMTVHSSSRAVPLYQRAGFAAREALRDMELGAATGESLSGRG